MQLCVKGSHQVEMIENFSMRNKCVGILSFPFVYYEYDGWSKCLLEWVKIKTQDTHEQSLPFQNCHPKARSSARDIVCGKQLLIWSIHNPVGFL